MDGDTLVLRRERHPPFLSPAVPEAVVSSVCFNVQRAFRDGPREQQPRGVDRGQGVSVIAGGVEGAFGGGAEQTVLLRILLLDKDGLHPSALRWFWSVALTLDTSCETKKERIHLYSLMASHPAPVPKPKRTRRDALPSEKLETAKTHLQLSWVPSHIPCREEEHAAIAAYLRSSIQQGGNGSPLYISGMPGTGKTATVREVIEELRSEGLDFDVVLHFR